MRLVNIKSKATKKPSVDIVEAENRKASKFRNNLLVELEVAGNVTSHRFDTRVSDSYGTAIEYITEWIQS
jgi:hypothetical protein